MCDILRNKKQKKSYKENKRKSINVLENSPRGKVICDFPRKFSIVIHVKFSEVCVESENGLCFVENVAQEIPFKD